jgi:hypothetical protein
MKKLTKADIPEGYKYAAVNYYGIAYAFKAMPIICYNCLWLPTKSVGGYTRIKGNFDWEDWQNSLVSVED